MPNNYGGDGAARVNLYCTHHESGTRVILQRRGVELDGFGAVQKERGMAVRGRRAVRDFTRHQSPSWALLCQNWAPEDKGRALKWRR